MCSSDLAVGTRQQQVSLTHIQQLNLPAPSLEAIRLPHRVQTCLLKEVPDVVAAWDGRVLERAQVSLAAISAMTMELDRA